MRLLLKLFFGHATIVNNLSSSFPRLAISDNDLPLVYSVGAARIVSRVAVHRVPKAQEAVEKECASLRDHEVWDAQKPWEWVVVVEQLENHCFRAVYSYRLAQAAQQSVNRPSEGASVVYR